MRSVPVARLRAAPWNPREADEPRFLDLCRSIEADPLFLWHRPICARADGTVYAGNLRLRAVMHLGWSEVPAIVGDVPEALAKARALRDNNPIGEWRDEDLAGLLEELTQNGVEIGSLGFADTELEWLGAGEHKAGISAGRESFNMHGFVRVVLGPMDVRRLEQALVKTGIRNRAEAFSVILDAYLGEQDLAL